MGERENAMCMQRVEGIFSRPPPGRIRFAGTRSGGPARASLHHWLVLSALRAGGDVGGGAGAGVGVGHVFEAVLHPKAAQERRTPKR